MRQIVLGMLFCVVWTFAQKPKLAINDFEAIGFPESDAAIISERLRSETVNTHAFTVLERNAMNHLLTEQAFQKTSEQCIEQECESEQGKVLGVQYLGTGSIGKIGSLTSISFRLLDVETGEIVFSTSMEVDNGIENILKGPIQSIVKQMTKAIHPSDQSTVDLASSPTNSSLDKTPAQETTITTKPPQKQLPMKPRGHAGPALTWVIPFHDINQSIDISNDFIGGLSLRPSDQVKWINHQNHYAMDSISAFQYEEMDQNHRKAVLYGRLLYLGSHRISENVGIQAEQLQDILQKNHQQPDFNLDADIANAARIKAKRINNAVLYGGGTMAAGYMLMALIRNTNCHNGYCETEYPLFPFGLAVAIVGLSYGLYRYNVVSTEEKQAYEKVQKAYQNLSTTNHVSE